MIFSVDKGTNQLLASLPGVDGDTGRYVCDISACANPVCTCETICLDVRPIDCHGAELPAGPSRCVSIDVARRKIVRTGTLRTPAADIDFAKRMVGGLDEKDFELLAEKQFLFKNHRTNTAADDSIEYDFDYAEVEENGLMYAYNDVLPYGDPFHINFDGQHCLVLDQFCLLPKCACTDTALSVYALNPNRRMDEEMYRAGLTYAKRRWKSVECIPPARPPIPLQALIEGQIPDFYSQLKTRHLRMKRIYAHCKQREFGPVTPIERPKVGRNAPCPCGSGKKFKKCCG